MPAQNHRLHHRRTGAVLRLFHAPAAGLYAVLRANRLAAAGAILQDVWLTDVSMPVIDCLGEEFLNYVQDGMTVTVKENGLVEVD